MKTILVIAAIAALYSCTAPKELQAEMTSAQLIKIDTAYQDSSPRQILTWRDDNKIEYVTYVPMNNIFLVGSRMIVLIKR